MNLFRSKTVADELIERLVEAGVERIYGIVGESLNPVSEAIRRCGKSKWIHVRYEEGAANFNEFEQPKMLIILFTSLAVLSTLAGDTRRFSGTGINIFSLHGNKRSSARNESPIAEPGGFFSRHLGSCNIALAGALL